MEHSLWVGVRQCKCHGRCIRFHTADFSVVLASWRHQWRYRQPIKTSGSRYMLLATLIHRASLPSPNVSAQQALNLLEEHYGLCGTLQALGSQQDLNYRVDSDKGRFVLKICHGDYATLELQAQHAGLAHLGER